MVSLEGGQRQLYPLGYTATAIYKATLQVGHRTWCYCPDGTGFVGVRGITEARQSMVGPDFLPGGPETSLHEVEKVKPKLQGRPQNVTNLLRTAAAIEWIWAPLPLSYVCYGHNKGQARGHWSPGNAEQGTAGLMACWALVQSFCYAAILPFQTLCHWIICFT